MKLKTARLCVDCESIYDLLRSLICGLKDKTQCPECGSHSTILLSNLIPTMAEYETVLKKTGDIPVGEVCL
jgi:hypothetical protein